MPKKEKTYAVCPSCSQKKDRFDVTSATSLLANYHKGLYKYYKALEVDEYQGLFNHIEWACDMCLASRKAITANPHLQQTPAEPHIAYHDTPLVCTKCKQEFIFKKEEKQLWYEGLKFEIHAQPDECLPCRKETRKLKRENNVLTTILKKAESELTMNDLTEVVSVYAEWGKEEKVKYYKALAQKLEKRIK